jgi:hypothetical protein
VAIQLLKEYYSGKITETKIIPVAEVEIINIIGSLKFKNSSGYDEMSNRYVPLLYHCFKWEY